MLLGLALNSGPLNGILPGTGAPLPYAGFVDFDVLDDVIGQYLNSPVTLAVVEAMGDWLSGQDYDDLFYFDVWNLDTARGWGLDVLGRIVVASRIIALPSESSDFIGFAGQTSAQNWGHGLWNRGANSTQNVALTDIVYRRVILVKALANICGTTIPELNRLIMLLFPDYGNSYVIDNLNKSLTYHFGADLSPIDFAIVSQENLLPRPSGYSVTITQGP